MISDDAIIIAALALFLVMGVAALARPLFVTRQFGIHDLGPDARNEVRAVYGGFGIAIALALGVAWREAALREGICLTVALALAGMAAGRIISALIDRKIGKWPAFYFTLEAVAAALLSMAARG